MPDAPDPTLFAIPLYLVAMLLEVPILRRMSARGADVRGYPDRRDTAASLAMGLGSVPIVTAINAAVYLLATLAWPHRIVDFGDTGAGLVAKWTLAIVGWDFAYYWHHRIEHEVRLFWACHVSHHSSQYFNFSTALRQPWSPVLGIALYPPLALLGVPPWMILVSGGLNLVFQFWVHTEVVGKLPRPIELVFNTPSHHRVHHGRNPQYLDKNYAGIFIVWDRLFRTFEPEGERVVYGLTHNIETYNPLRIAFHEYVALAGDVRRATSAREAFARVFRGPGFVRVLADQPSAGTQRS